MNVEERVVMLEWELRDAKRWLLTLAIVAAALVVLFAILWVAGKFTGPPDVVAAKQFVLVDDMGRSRAMLRMFTNDAGEVLNGPALVLADENGRRQALFCAEPGNSQLVLSSGVQGAPTVSAIATQDGATIGAGGTQGIYPRIEMSMYEDAPKLGIRLDDSGYAWAVPYP